MKQFILLFVIATMARTAFGQCCPQIHASTVIPASPTPTDMVKIVTHVSTPNQGVVVHTSFTVTHVTKKIELEGCYSDGMLPAIQNHIDTFHVGQLQAGTYTVSHTAFMSQAQQWCNKIDSNTAGPLVINVILPVPNSLGEVKAERNVSVFPNPAKDRLRLAGLKEGDEIGVYSQLGELVMEVKNPGTNIDISALNDGIYFLRSTSSKAPYTGYFIKLDR